MAYITASSGQFNLSGARFRFLGINCYLLIQGDLSTSELDDFFHYCNLDRITVVRAWCFNQDVPATNNVGNFRYKSGSTLQWIESTFISLDRVLDSARRHGVRLILPLVDNNGNNKEDYLTWNDAINGTSYGANEWEFFDDTNIRQMYKDFVDKLSARVNTINGQVYSTDDTIFSIELGNELRYDKGGDPNINTPSSYNFAQLGKSGGWADVMSTYIRTKFPNHLIGYGDLGHTNDYVTGDTVHNGTLYGVDYTLTGALTNISYFDFHLYAYDGSYNLQKYGQSLGEADAASARGLTRQIRDFIKIAKANNKPCIIGEWGIDKRNTSNNLYPSYPRQNHFKKLFSDFYDSGGDGILLWHYSTESILDDNNYNIRPDGAHSGDYDNGNENDDDSSLRSLIAQTANRVGSKRIVVDSVRGVSI